MAMHQRCYNHVRELKYALLKEACKEVSTFNLAMQPVYETEGENFTKEIKEEEYTVYLMQHFMSTPVNTVPLYSGHVTH